MKTYKRILANSNFNAPDHWLKIRTIDMHTGGEPLRVIVDGFPPLAGSNVLEYRRYIRDNHDLLRKALMFEPRGHADMYGCVLVPPNSDDADFGIVFMHNEGYSTMCGHAIIAISTLAVKMHWVDSVDGENLIKIDAPCGRIDAYVNVKEGNLLGVRFLGVPSFVLALDQLITIPDVGQIHYDLAYGGAFYAYVDADQIGIKLTSDNYQEIITIGKKIKAAVMASDNRVIHPFEEELSFLYGTIFIGGPVTPGIDSRNVCVFADGEVDRSPTGSGVSGRMAIHHARNELKIGEKMSIESITGSVFYGSIVEELIYGEYKAVIPEVMGTAHVTGANTFLIDPDDPMKDGFILR